MINERLDSIASTDPEQTRQVDGLRQDLDDYVKLATGFARRVDNGQVGDFAAEAQAVTAKLIETATLFAEYRTYNFDKFVTGIDDAQSAARVALWISVIASVSIIAAVVFAGLLISNLMTGSLSRLVTFAQRVAGGDL